MRFDKNGGAEWGEFEETDNLVGLCLGESEGDWLSAVLLPRGWNGLYRKERCVWFQSVASPCSTT